MKKDSWLYSDNFLKRCFAIYGHNLVASLIVGIVVWIIMGTLFAGLIMAGFGQMFESNHSKRDSMMYEDTWDDYENEDWLEFEEPLEGDVPST